MSLTVKPFAPSQSTANSTFSDIAFSVSNENLYSLPLLYAFSVVVAASQFVSADMALMPNDGNCVIAYGLDMVLRLSMRTYAVRLLFPSFCSTSSSKLPPLVALLEGDSFVSHELTEPPFLSAMLLTAQRVPPSIVTATVTIPPCDDKLRYFSGSNVIMAGRCTNVNVECTAPFMSLNTTGNSMPSSLTSEASI